MDFGFFEDVWDWVKDRLGLRSAEEQLLRLLGDANSEFGKGMGSLWDELRKVPYNLSKNTEKAAADFVEQLKASGRDTEVAYKAISKFSDRQARAYIDINTAAFERVKSGHVIESIWGFVIDYVRRTEENSGQLMLDSELVRTLATIAAGSLGPGGAAAFAAWLTYRETHDFDLAIRSGVIAGSVAWATQGIKGKVPTTDSYSTAKKAIVIGAIGGAAVAGAGGDQNAVRDGFLKSGAMIVIQDGFKNYDGHELTAEPNMEETPYSVSAEAETSETNPLAPPKEAYQWKDGKVGGTLITDENKIPILDTKYLDKNRMFTGMKGHFDLNKSQIGWKTEGSFAMSVIEKIPGAHGMSIFHDQWAGKWVMGDWETKLTIAPAVVLTYWGLGAPYYEDLQRLYRETYESEIQLLARLSKSQEGPVAAATPHPPRRVGSIRPPIERDAVILSYLCTRGRKSIMVLVDRLMEEKDGVANELFRLVLLDRWNSRVLSRTPDFKLCSVRAARYVRQLRGDGYKPGGFCTGHQLKGAKNG